MNNNFFTFCSWVIASFAMGLYMGYDSSHDPTQHLPTKGQHFDIRGGSTVIEVNEKDSVVWFRNDSTYFYETYKTLGIDGR